MKKVSIVSTLLVFLAFAGMSFTVPADGGTQTLSVNIEKSEIVWKGYKVTGSHHGNVQLKNGKLDMKDGQLAGGSFEIDMATITCNDLSGEWAKKLEGHLKSDDFFGVEKYPTAKFVITQAIPYGKPGVYKIVGNLTIKETTKPVKFQAELTEEGGSTVATTAIKIDRSEYDVRYGSGSFFDNLGDKTIYDEFDMEIKLVAGK